MSHVINSRALTGEKPCINKAIHALLMHGYATLNMIEPAPQICCGYEMCTARPQKKHILWKLRLRDIGEKAKQNSARNNANCSKCFQFLCNNSDRTWFFNALTFARSLGRCWKPRPPASVFQHLHRDLANVNAWKTMFDPYKMVLNKDAILIRGLCFFFAKSWVFDAADMYLVPVRFVWIMDVDMCSAGVLPRRHLLTDICDCCASRGHMTAAVCSWGICAAIQYLLFSFYF